VGDSKDGMDRGGEKPSTKGRERLLTQPCSEKKDGKLDLSPSTARQSARVASTSGDVLRKWALRREAEVQANRKKASPTEIIKSAGPRPEKVLKGHRKKSAGERKDKQVKKAIQQQNGDQARKVRVKSRRQGSQETQITQ